MRRVCVIAALLFGLASAQAQTREESEKAIAKLPPDQQAYERYRYWTTMQPPGAGDQQAKYREYLTAQGFNANEVERQIQVIDKQGRKLEVERWNRILTAEKPSFNTNPNGFLVEMVKGRSPGAALDVGMGQGRNAIWLAQQGWNVTGFDPAEKAVALAKENAGKLGVHLTTELKGMEEFDFGENRWDLIVMTYVGGRGFSKQIQRALKPNGILVIEGVHRDATRGRSIGGAVVFDTGELPTLFPELRVVRYEEPMAVSDFGQQPRVRVARYCAEKSAE